MEKTLSIIKPDGIKRDLIGKIIKKIEEHNIKIIAVKMIYLTKKQAGIFYQVHKKKKFFESLTTFMSSGPSLVMILEGPNVIEKYRNVMGNTNYKKAKQGTIREEFATSIEKNVVHGSDSQNSAIFEISFFFNSLEIFPKNN